MTSYARAPYSPHTVPAIQQMARTIADQADKAESDAVNLRRAANELAAIAAHVARLHDTTTSPDTPTRTRIEHPCPTCDQPTYDDGLGPRHTNPHIPCTPPTQQLATTDDDTGDPDQHHNDEP